MTVSGGDEMVITRRCKVREPGSDCTATKTDDSCPAKHSMRSERPSVSALDTSCTTCRQLARELTSEPSAWGTSRSMTIAS